MHGGQAKRLVRAGQEDVEPGTIDVAVEDQLDRPILRLPAAGVDMEGAVLEADPCTRQPEPGREYLQICKVDDPVIAALEIGGERRQAAGEALEKAVVEAADPGLGGADH